MHPATSRHAAVMKSDIRILTGLSHSISGFGKNSILTSLVCTPSNTNCISKSCPHPWIPCWLLTNTAVTSAVTNFQCHKLIAK